MKDLFISFAQKDEGFVRNLCSDLEHSGFEIWEFKTKGSFGVNFIKEFNHQLRQSNFFCLIDSNEARKSKYVAKEVSLALKLQKKIVICKIDSCISEVPLFKNQNYITGFNFYQDYYSCITELCTYLGRTFVPIFKIPADKDFIFEMQRIDMVEKGLQTKEWQLLIEDYKIFRDEFKTNKEHAAIKLQEIIYKLNKFKIIIISPYLALANLYSICHAHSQALHAYQEAYLKFGKDPRILSGLGYSYYRLNRFKESKEKYLECLEILTESTVEKHREHIIEVMHNLCQVSLELIDDDFIFNPEKFPEKGMQIPQIIALVGKFFLNNGKFESATYYLVIAFQQLKDRVFDSPSTALYVSNIILDLAVGYKKSNDCDCEKEILIQGIYLMQEILKVTKEEVLKNQLSEMWKLLGDYYLNCFKDSEYDCLPYINNHKSHHKLENRVKLCVDCYENAIKENDDIKYWAELAMIYFKFSINGIRDILIKCFAFEENKLIISDDHIYYLGLAYFLDGQIELAKNKYQLSKKKNWLFYSELFS